MGSSDDAPVVTELFPIINAGDVATSVAFWRDLMGGTVAFAWPGPDGAPVYVGIDLGPSSHLGIGGPSAVSSGTRPIAIWVYVDSCDAMVDRLRRAGVRITAEPVDQPWGERVARVLDPDGNEVIIGQRSTAPAEPDGGSVTDE